MQILGKDCKLFLLSLVSWVFLSSKGNYRVWKKIQAKIGESQQKTAQECCTENLHKEVEVTIASGILPLDDGHVPVACSRDTGWQGGSSHIIPIVVKPLFVGDEQKRLLHISISQSYATPAMITKNTRWVAAPQHKNWSRSSKSMELQSILECIKTILNSGIAVLHTFISDNDSSSRAFVKHPILIQIEKGIILRWPLDKHGKNVKSTGHLPEEIHALLMYFVNSSCCCYVYGFHLYKLERILTVKE